MPGLRGALGVRVNDGRTDRIVSRYCRGLKFTKVAPGGHQSISVRLNLPRNTFADLGPEDRIYVHDSRTTKTIIEGYIENPTPVDGAEGQAYDIAAVGGMALVNDETRPLIYIDTLLDGWERDNNNGCIPSANVEVGNLGGSIPGVRDQFPSGNVLATGGRAAAIYLAMSRAGMLVGGFSITITGGKTDGNYTRYIITDSGGLISATLTTVPAVVTAYVVTNFPANATTVHIWLQRTGVPVNVADETSFVNGTAISIIGQRMDRSGTLLTAAAGLVSTTQVLASQVVEDLLGRLMTFCDGPLAQVDATSFGITQLAYPDGVKAAGVLNDLAVFEPNFLWEILESLENGKHRFNFRAWPTTPRYEVSTRDGWRQTGADVDLCNRILVTWTDAAGAKQVTTVTAASLGLIGLGYPVDDLGSRVKDADPITLPDGKGSAANATRIGGQILTDKINPPKTGTVLVRRRILDQLTGTMVMPWEIEPGYLCRVRETGDDLRITQADYDDDSCSMLLTLGAPVLTDEQRLARLDRAAGIVLIGA